LIVVYYNVDYSKDPKGTNYLRNRILKTATEFAKGKARLTFAISNKDSMAHELEEYGLGDRKSEAILVTGQGKDGQKYHMAEPFSLENLKKFAENVRDGKLEAYMKSEAVPEKNDQPVKILVAKNFKEIIRPDTDALIEFYAPWCGHCKKLAPIYDELAEKLKAENVVIAKMDATANDVPPEFEVRGFPTIYWLPKGKSPQAYNGGRELDDFVQFIAKEASQPLAGYDRSGKKSKKKKQDEL